MICDRCHQPDDQGAHGVGLCPYEPRGASAAVIPDSIPGGLTVENLAPTPITFYSQSQRKQYLKAHGIREQVRHVGAHGSDKSAHTSRWV